MGDPVRLVLSAGALCLTVVVLLIVAGYAFGWRWTGYRGGAKDETRPLWDWLTLLLQPLTIALLPLWLHSRARRGRAWWVAAAAAAVALLVMVVGGYRLGWTWTGFTGNTLWDWLNLFLMPFLLPLVLLVVVNLGGRSGRDAPSGRAHVAGNPGAGATGPAVGGAGSAPPTPSARMATAVAFAILFLGAGFGLGRMAGGTEAAAQGVSHSSDSAACRGGCAVPLAVQHVIVLARDRSWTPTALAVREGEVVRVTAFGSVEAHAVKPGQRRRAGVASGHHALDRHPPAGSVDRAMPHAALLATVSRSGETFPLSHHPSYLVPVGAHRRFVARRTGVLLLGLNETRTKHDSGYVAATVTLWRR